MAVHLILMGAAGGSSAPTTGTYWITTYGVSGQQQWAQDVTVDSAGNIYVVNTGTPGAGTAFRFNYSKFAGNGPIIWQKYRSGSVGGPDYATSIAITTDDLAWVGGSIAVNGSQGYTDQLNASTGGVSYPFLVGNPTGSFNNYVVGLGLNSSNQPRYGLQSNSIVNSGYAIGQIAANVLAWSRRFSTPRGLTVTSSVVSATNELYVCGRARETTSASSDTLFFTCYNSAGTYSFSGSILTTLGIARFPASNRCACMSVNGANIYTIASYSSVYLLVGSADVSSLFYPTRRWMRRVTFPSAVQPASICRDSSNNVYVVGYIGTTGFLLKYNTNGVLQFQRTITNLLATGVYWRNSIVYICGSTTSTDASYDAALMKIPDNGSLTGTYGSFVYAASSYTDADISASFDYQSATFISNQTTSTGVTTSAPSYTTSDTTYSTAFNLIQA